MELIIILTTGALSLLLIITYNQGVRVGINLSKGIPPKPIKSPVKVMQEIKENTEAKKEADKLNQEFTDIMSATKESMLDAMKKGI